MATTPENGGNFQGNSNVVVVLAGPTGVGKSDVAVCLCGWSQGMIVSADSVQAYRGVQIGANKPSAQERLETPHILVDVADVTTSYNAAEWQRDALYVISELLSPGHDDSKEQIILDEKFDNPLDHKRRQEIDWSIRDARQLKGYSATDPILPVVVGGTMMYLQWLVHGRPDAARPPKEAVEKSYDIIQNYQSQQDWKGAKEYVAKQGSLFEERIKKLGDNDWYRLRRTLEIALTVQLEQDNLSQETSNDTTLIQNLFTGQREASLGSFGYDVRCFFLCPDDRMEHTALVDERCEIMIQKGLIEETTRLSLAGKLPDMAARAIGYRQTLDYLQREAPRDDDQDAFEEYLQKFATVTRQYSKKQMQWFRKDGSFVFVPVAVSENKATRVHEAARKIQDMVQLPRKEYESRCFAKDSVSAKTIAMNEAQAKGMKFYQPKRYLLKPGTPAFMKALEDADKCTYQIHAKKPKTQRSCTFE